ncbi:hypothetical protein BDZ97DRAFT_1923916 [Flammula alnicola]|nr:hypothetical protein BDZ97DRAFT_1923916 [Flammula alnicola]
MSLPDEEQNSESRQIDSAHVHEVDILPPLPQELIDHIIEIVVAEWHATPSSIRKECTAVARCMLVSRSFLASVRRPLFAHISTNETQKPTAPGTTPPSETARMENLLKILKADPLRDRYPLSAHVRSIKIAMDPLASKAKDNGPGDNSQPSLKADSVILDWNARRVNMREVLRMLPNLNSFALEFTSPISGHSLHVGISLPIEKVCQSSLLTSLHFANIYYFPVDILAGCTNLRYLCLLNIYTGRAEGVGSNATQKTYAPTLLFATWNKRSLQNLESLETENSGDVFEEIKLLSAKATLPVYFSRLKKLTLGVPVKSGLNSLREVHMMGRAAHKLESLTIRGIATDVSLSRFPGHICLSDLTSLRNLR